MDNRITRTAEEILANASPSVRDLCLRLEQYVERKHRERPEIPVESWWGAIEAELIDLIEDRAEG